MDVLMLILPQLYYSLCISRCTLRTRNYRHGGLHCTIILIFVMHISLSVMDENEKTSREDELILLEYRVDSYNPNKAVRLSNDLFDVAKSVSTITSTHALKLFYAIAQAVQDKSVEVVSGIPRINLSVQAAFDYLAIRTSNRRYELLKASFEAVMNNSLHLVQKDRNGNISFRGLSWISGYVYSTNKDRLHIILNPLAMPFLRELSRYASIQPKYYNELSTTYQLWLYPFLKNKEKMGSFRVRIDELKILLNTDTKESYNDEMRGTNVFFKRVLGITISKAAKEENARAKKEKTLPSFAPWDYVLDKSGKPTGTLFNINTHTDLVVSARGIKSGRSYEEVEFIFVSPSFFNQEAKKGISGGVEDATPDLFPEEKKKSLGFEPIEGWGWVVQTEEETQKMLEDFHVSTKEKLVSLSQFLQLREDGKVHRYKELPFFSEKKG